MDDQVTEPVQSDGAETEATDQGGGGNDAPYAEYLDRIPEEVRDDVEPVFKDWDANVTRRFQEASEYRKGWEPYEQSGVNQLPPEEVGWLVQFRGALDDPQAMQQWWNSYAEQAGLTPDEPKAAQGQEPQAPTFDEFVAPDTQQLQELLKQELSPLQQQLQQMHDWREQQEYAAREAEAQRFVDSQVEELKAKHPDEWNQDAMEKLVTHYVHTDPEHAVERAFADWQTLRTQIERDTLQGKANQPAPAESGGVANAAADETKTMAEASSRAREFIRHMHS